MTIRSDFQSDVEQFINDLEVFATGSYLRQEDKEFWEQPFDPQVLPELRQLVERMLEGFDALPDDPEGPALASVAKASIEQLEEFNARHADAVLEPEEWEEIHSLMTSAAMATGADDEALAELPTLDD